MSASFLVSGGGPMVLAFSETWADRPAESDLARMRAELRGLGASLVVCSPTGTWSFRPDDDLEQHDGGASFEREAVRWGIDRASVAGGALAIVIVDRREPRFAEVYPADGRAPETRLADALAAAGRALLHAPEPARVTRRELVIASLVGAFALVLGASCRKPPTENPTPPVTSGTVHDPPPAEVAVTLIINGKTHALTLDPRVSLLDLLRNRLSLPGTKKGCDHGQCGACTVLVDGERMNACLLLAVTLDGAKITTIEGLAPNDGELHPVQRAFVTLDAFQCGYCTPGQILSAVALLREGHARTDDEVREAMSGNICRCGAYANIVPAVQLARKEAT